MVHLLIRRIYKYRSVSLLSCIDIQSSGCKDFFLYEIKTIKQKEKTKKKKKIQRSKEEMNKIFN